MIGYVTLGADDLGRAKRFYAAFLPAPVGQPLLPDFYVKPTFDGRPASAGNGTMVAFQARSQQEERDLHAAALAAGGTDEGAPGFRAAYGAHFFVAYLRDPQGNKIALFSNDPNAPGRDG